MSPDKQRIAIAEACGWVAVEQPTRKNARWIYRSPEGRCFCTVWKKGGFGGDSLPDYLHDLNSMHEAEKTLFGGAFKRYIRALTDICQTPEDAVFANAEQRAEALLRTIGKWEDDK